MLQTQQISMDKLSDASTPSSTQHDNQTSEPSQESTDRAGVGIRCENRSELQPLYGAVLGPIEDLLDGDKLIVVPDGALSKAPWVALSEDPHFSLTDKFESHHRFSK